MYQDILYSVEDGIAILTINRPKVLNAIRLQTYHDIIAALKESDSNDQVKVMVITGAEGRFSSGNDLSDLLPGADLQALNQDRKSTRLNSSHVRISYAVFCLKKK